MISRAEAAKTKANQLLIEAKYAAAIEKYSEAINLNPQSLYYSNRAEAYLRWGKFPGVFI